MSYRIVNIALMVTIASFCMLSISHSYALSEDFENTQHDVLDSDGDLLPDWWENAYSSILDANQPDETYLDPDNDGLSNIDEFFAQTNPTVYNHGNEIYDRQLSQLFQGKAFLYYWQQSRHAPYFTKDRARFEGTDLDRAYSNAATGFSLLSYIVADEKGWMSHQKIYERILTLVKQIEYLQQDAFDHANEARDDLGNRRGYTYHFMNQHGFRNGYDDEISSIDHALLVCGVLTAAEYFKGTEVETIARRIYENTNWKWLWNPNSNLLYQGWEPGVCPHTGLIDLDGGWLRKEYDWGSEEWIPAEWNRYSELLILLFLSMGADTSYNVPKTMWDSLAPGGNLFQYQRVETDYALLDETHDNTRAYSFVANMPHTYYDSSGNPIWYLRNTATDFNYMHAGSLHNHQYSHMVCDFRNRRDKYGVDFYANSVNATMANRQFCISLNQQHEEDYETYNDTFWGLMAGETATRNYQVMQPLVTHGDLTGNYDNDLTLISVNTDSGTALPNAALGSTAFTPRHSLDVARFTLAQYQNQAQNFDAIIDRYGLMNAVNFGFAEDDDATPGHFNGDTIGLDMGPIVANIENHHTGLIWKFAMRNEFIRRGMEKVEFPIGPVEPYIMNFDDNPPLPAEDVYADDDVSDINSFGGFFGTFGTGTLTPTWIGTSYHTESWGPRDYVQEISTTDNNDSGVFMTLNNHSVSHADRLSFWVRTTETDYSPEYLVGLKDSGIDKTNAPLEQTEVKLPISRYHPDGHITTEWTEVRIPLEDFLRPPADCPEKIVAHFTLQSSNVDEGDWGIRLTGLDALSFSSNCSIGGTIQIDDIAFLGDEFAPSKVDNLSATLTGSTVTLSWDPSKEGDVVGYRIYRKHSTEEDFSLLNTTALHVTTVATDTVESDQYSYYVTAVDNAAPANESEASDEVSIMVNTPPVLNFIGNRSANTLEELSFTITASDTNAGDTLSFSAELLNGDPISTIGAEITSLGGGFASFSWTPAKAQGSSEGTPYDIRVFVHDSQAAEDSETFSITVYYVNHIPIADAGDDQTVDANQLVTLDGTQSYDPDSDTLSYTWDISEQPQGASVTLSDSTSVNPSFTPLIAGTYVFSLIASDGTDASVADTVTITVREDLSPTSIQGTVSLLNYDGQTETSHGGAVLYLWGRTAQGSWLSPLHVRSASNGSFTFHHIPEGFYVILARANGYRFSPYVTYHTHPGSTVSFTARASRSWVMPPNSGTYSIEGNVESVTNGEDIGQTHIYVSGFSSYPRKRITSKIITDESGRYQIENLPSGYYYVTSSKWGWTIYPHHRIRITNTDISAVDFKAKKRTPWYHWFTRWF